MYMLNNNISINNKLSKIKALKFKILSFWFVKVFHLNVLKPMPIPDTLLIKLTLVIRAPI